MEGRAHELQAGVFYRSFAKSTAAKRSQCRTMSLLRCRHYILTDALCGLPISYPTTQYLFHALVHDTNSFNGLILSSAEHPDIGFS